ncbi:hypothetical protein Tco_0072547 [Tanacetum coccineum]
MATCHHLSGATWHFYCSPPSPVNLRSTAAGPPVNGSQRWSMTVNDAGPPVNGGGQRRSTVADHRSTTAGPPLDHRRTIGQRWLTASQGGSTVGPGQVGYWAGSSIGLDRAKYWAGSSSGHRSGQVGSWAGSSRVMGRVGSPRVSCHVSTWDPLADMSAHVASTCR